MWRPVSSDGVTATTALLSVLVKPRGRASRELMVRFLSRERLPWAVFARCSHIIDWGELVTRSKWLQSWSAPRLRLTISRQKSRVSTRLPLNLRNSRQQPKELGRRHVMIAKDRGRGMWLFSIRPGRRRDLGTIPSGTGTTGRRTELTGAAAQHRESTAPPPMTTCKQGQSQGHQCAGTQADARSRSIPATRSRSSTTRSFPASSSPTSAWPARGRRSSNS